jgi:hypothetical protein
MMNLKYVSAAALILALISLSAFAAVGMSAMAKQGNDGATNQGKTDMAKQMAQEEQERMDKLRDRFALQHYIFLNNGPNFADFLSVRTNNSLQAFVLKVHDEGVPTIYVAMANVTGEDGNKTAAWVTGVLKVFGVQEYIDTNGDGIYTPGNDTKLTWVGYASLDWTLTTTSITANGVSGWQIVMTASSDGATYVIRTQVFKTGVNLPDGTPLAPEEAKVDFIISNFPYNSTSSRLALITTFGGMEGSAEVTHVDNQTEAIINRNAFAYFTWASTAIVDGSTVPVVSTSKGNGVIKTVELNYPHGTNITHDPVVGVGSGSTQDIPSYQVPAPANTIAPALPGIYFLAATALVIVGVGALALAAGKRMVEPKLQA